MKKIFIFIIAIIIVFSIAACNGAEEVKAPSEAMVENAEPEIDVEDIKYPNMYIGIDDGDGGYYSLMSIGTVKQDEYGYYEIFIDDPTLLAFKISEKRYPGGIGTISGEEMDSMISLIEAFISENNVDNDTAAFLENLLKQLNDIPIITGAST